MFGVSRSTLLALVCASYATLGFGMPSATRAQPAVPASPSPAAVLALPIRIPLAAGALAGLPRRSVTVTEEHGGTATYEGVALAAVLARANVPAGKALRGPALAAVALVHASDGYRVAFALPELDPAFTDDLVLLADTRNGQPLDARLGPFRVIVPHEKREARWIRNVDEIDVVAVP